MILQAVTPINSLPEISENDAQAMYDGSSAAFVSGEFRFFIDSMHGLSPEDYVITQDSYDSILSSIDIDLVRCPSCGHSGNLEWTDKSYVRSVINTAEDNAVPRKIRIAVVYCSDRNHKMKWLIIVASNFENNIKNIYKGVCKRDVPLLLAEQEYRFNHRYTGRHFMEKIAKYVRKSVPMTNQAIMNVLDRYEDKFVFA